MRILSSCYTLTALELQPDAQPVITQGILVYIRHSGRKLGTTMTSQLQFGSFELIKRPLGGDCASEAGLYTSVCDYVINSYLIVRKGQGGCYLSDLETDTMEDFH